MSYYTNKLSMLEKQHAILNKRIDGKENTGVYSDTEMAEMKKQRLALRDKIEMMNSKYSQSEVE